MLVADIYPLLSCWCGCGCSRGVRGAVVEVGIFRLEVGRTT